MINVYHGHFHDPKPTLPLGELPGGQLPVVCDWSWQQHRGLTVVTVPPRSNKVGAVPQCGSQGGRQRGLKQELDGRVDFF